MGFEETHINRFYTINPMIANKKIVGRAMMFRENVRLIKVKVGKKLEKSTELT